jgi:glycosidase
LIYSGQELPNLKRLKFFDKDPIEWTGRTQLHDFYKVLNRLRKQHPAINTASATQPVRLATTQNERIFVFLRRYENRQLLVLLNLSPQPASIQLSEGQVQGTFTNIFDNQPFTITPQSTIDLKAWDYLVLSDQ